MNDFHDDDKWQREVRDAIVVPQFYARYAVDGRFILLDDGEFCKRLQREMGVDTLVCWSNGKVIAFEEKIVRWKGRPYTAFALETKSCTLEGIEKTGWMFYGDADLLLYCFQQEDESLIAYVIKFRELQKWFWPRESTFPTFTNKKRNRSSGRVVPIKEVDGAGLIIKNITLTKPESTKA